MRGIESANLLLSRAVCGRSPAVFGRSVDDAGAVAGRAARAWPRVLYGAVLGLWSLTGDGASFNAASASAATDVRWKKLTGMFGAAFSCKLALDLQSLWRWEMALGPRGLLAPDLSRVAWTGGGSSEGWLRGWSFAPSVLHAANPESELQKELAQRRAASRAPTRALVGAPRIGCVWCSRVLVH